MTSGSSLSAVGSQEVDRGESHLLRNRDHDAPFAITHRTTEEAASPGVDERMHVVEQPVVGARRAVEPGSVVQAHHALRVALEVQRAPADAGPVVRVPDQRGAHVIIIRKVEGYAK